MRNVKKGLTHLLIACAITFLLLAVLHSQTQESALRNTSTAIESKGFVVDLPQRAYWNSNVTVSVEAAPSTSCELSYISPAGILSKADGLGYTTAGANGLCSWNWKIEETKRKGASRVIITVGDVSETHFIEIWSGY